MAKILACLAIVGLLALRLDALSSSNTVNQLGEVSLETLEKEANAEELFSQEDQENVDECKLGIMQDEESLAQIEDEDEDEEEALDLNNSLDFTEESDEVEGSGQAPKAYYRCTSSCIKIKNPSENLACGARCRKQYNVTLGPSKESLRKRKEEKEKRRKQVKRCKKKCKRYWVARKRRWCRNKCVNDDVIKHRGKCDKTCKRHRCTQNCQRYHMQLRRRNCRRRCKRKYK